jgi:DNA-directed RNA polymerase alpha subunit
MRKLSRRHNENLKKTKNVIHSSLEEAIKLLQQLNLLNLLKYMLI